MPFPRRTRRRPFLTSRWQIRKLDALCLFLSPTVRSTLTAWMKIYGETNDLPGLISGPIEVRFRRLREHTGADVFLLWTTPERWSSGEALSLWIPAMGLGLECRFDNGRLFVEKARPTTDEDRDPRRQRSAVGMELRPDKVELPQPDQDDAENASAGLVAAFERLLDRKWTSFVDPLREALEAEARDDTARAERLATPYAVATPRIGGQSESDPYRLSGVEASACAAFDEGEWLDLVDARGRVISSARLVRSDPAEGTLDVDVRGADPPTEGTVRPRPQTQILAQKRAILDELDNPTGGLANAVKLVASPASLPPPARRRPETFVNRLVAQNRSQVRAVSLALGLEEGQALMIQGPPGTGKSTTLAEILGQLVLRDQNVTVLVCSHSNHGVDNLLLKTLPYLESVPGLAIARVGLYDRVHPAAREHFVPPGEDLGAFNVVFTTVDALALQVEAGARTYDYAVLDEANRASILDSLIPLVRGRRFILVGDHLQLQPVLSEAEEQLRLEPAVGNTSAIGKSLFAWLRERRFPEAATIFLDEQNRMHPAIAGLISEVFYEGKLRSGRRAPRRVADVPLFPSAVTWVDTRGLHGLREARGRGASLVNVPEARLVATIARHILTGAQREVDVGVISAYAEQTALLRRLLIHRNKGQGGEAHGKAGGRANGLDKAALKHLEIDTVDAFEGREKDIIIVSLVRSNRRRDIGFLRLMQRINVALSRARTMLIVVGDTSTLRGSYFDRIVRYVRANGVLVPGPRLIGRLLNARAPERTGERVAVVGSRRRRALPSARTAFPEQDPTAARPSAPAAAAGDAAADGRNRRRRRQVRGRPGTEGRELAPTVSMGMTPTAEPAPDEPATQYEIDRFAALVEQLLGDGGSESDAAPEGGAVVGPDGATPEEILADAIRAVGEQTERQAALRSRRRDNRRRSRRGSGRPLPPGATGDQAPDDGDGRAMPGAVRRPFRRGPDAPGGRPSRQGGQPDQPYRGPRALGSDPPSASADTPGAQPPRDVMQDLDARLSAVLGLSSDDVAFRREQPPRDVEEDERPERDGPATPSTTPGSVPEPPAHGPGDALHDAASSVAPAVPPIRRRRIVRRPAEAAVEAGLREVGAPEAAAPHVAERAASPPAGSGAVPPEGAAAVPAPSARPAARTGPEPRPAIAEAATGPMTPTPGAPTSIGPAPVRAGTRRRRIAVPSAETAGTTTGAGAGVSDSPALNGPEAGAPPAPGAASPGLASPVAAAGPAAPAPAAAPVTGASAASGPVAPPPANESMVEAPTVAPRVRRRRTAGTQPTDIASGPPATMDVPAAGEVLASSTRPDALAPSAAVPLAAPEIPSLPARAPAEVDVPPAAPVRRPRRRTADVAAGSAPPALGAMAGETAVAAPPAPAVVAPAAVAASPAPAPAAPAVESGPGATVAPAPRRRRTPAAASPSAPELAALVAGAVGEAIVPEIAPTAVVRARRRPAASSETAPSSVTSPDAAAAVATSLVTAGPGTAAPMAPVPLTAGPGVPGPDAAPKPRRPRKSVAASAAPGSEPRGEAAATAAAAAAVPSGDGPAATVAPAEAAGSAPPERTSRRAGAVAAGVVPGPSGATAAPSGTPAVPEPVGAHAAPVTVAPRVRRTPATAPTPAVAAADPEPRRTRKSVGASTASEPAGAMGTAPHAEAAAPDLATSAHGSAIAPPLPKPRRTRRATITPAGGGRGPEA